VKINGNRKAVYKLIWNDYLQNMMNRYIIRKATQSVKNSNAGYSGVYNIKSVEKVCRPLNALSKTKTK